MDFGSLMFLSSRIMHHLFIQLSTNTGNRVQLREHLSTACSGRKWRETEGDVWGEEEEKNGMVQDKGQMWLCVYVCVRWLHLKDGPLGRPPLYICQSVSPLNSSCSSESVEGSASPLFCFDSVTGADCLVVHLDDDWWCLLNYGEAQTWSMAGPLRWNPNWTWVVLALVALVTHR